MIINGIEIKPGMILEWTPKSKRRKSNTLLVAFPIKNDIRFVSANSEQGWSSSYTSFIKELLIIREKSDKDFLDGGKIILKKTILIL